MATAAVMDVVPVGQFADRKLQAIAVETDLSADMSEWWKTQKCDTIQKVAAACTDEKEIRTTIIEQMNATKADMCKIIGDQAAVKLFWH